MGCPAPRSARHLLHPSARGEAARRREGGRSKSGTRHGDRTGGGGSKSLAVPAERKGHGRGSSNKTDRELRESFSRHFARSRSLDDLRESGNESNQDLSFDVETTMLTVAPSDLSEMGEEATTTATTTTTPPTFPPRRRAPSKVSWTAWRPCTVTSSRWWARRSLTGRAAGGGASRVPTPAPSGEAGMSGGSASTRASKDLRSIQRRFQRLESHVVTLARSLAHLSSELRAQNALRRDVDGVKREVREMKQQGLAAKAEGPPGLGAPFEKFRGWIPSLTNPKRINKLTQFFGQEPPLLEIFLKKLGYERYAKNFAAEHIGMIELPYMTEERLESIGIPMGPRLRILQESQLCFRQENFDIYIV